MNAQVKVFHKPRTFQHTGRLSRKPRIHKMSNDQLMVTFPVQVIENGKWLRIAVYDKEAISQAKKIGKDDVVAISGIIKRDYWTNKDGVACSADIFIANTIEIKAA